MDFVVLVVVFGISTAWLLQEMENTSQQLRQIAERNVELKQQLAQQESGKHEELQQQLIHQEKKHDQVALIQQLTGTNNALTLHPVGSIGPCDVSGYCILVHCYRLHSHKFSCLKYT